MPSTHSLIHRLKSDFPQFSFQESDNFLWSPGDQTVYYTDTVGGYTFLLHELSHGLLQHSDYSRDIELLAMERAAWDKAAKLAPAYGQAIDAELIETNLDTYRDWLHARSTCPRCQATGVQTKKRTYSCPACHNHWRVNEARICALRRYGRYTK